VSPRRRRAPSEWPSAIVGRTAVRSLVQFVETAMSQLTLAFHAELALPANVKALIGTIIECDVSWTVRQLASAIERRCTQAGAGVRVCTLINPVRGAAPPPHEPAKDHFRTGDKVIVLGDVRSAPWPSTDEAQAKPRTKDEPVPVTIFTGFLGSGKTTVLNYLLRGQREKKIAVIENEFGAVPIDQDLLKDGGAMDLAEQVVVMENGCMCCTVRGDLLGAFDQIRKQMDAGNQLDAVLIETTGMADPVPIVRTLRTTPDIARYFRLDGTITLVDSKTILDRLAESTSEDQERHRQISFADRILLNKIDIVNDAEVYKVWKTIRGYNENAKIIASVKGILPPSDLTNIGAFDADQISLEQEEGHGGGHGGGHGHEDAGHGHGHGDDCADDCTDDHGSGQAGHGAPAAGHGHGGLSGNQHDSEIGSFSIVRKGVEIDILEFERWIRVIATLPEEQGSLYRCKGILAAAGKPNKYIFHAVADVTETQEGPLWGENEQRLVKIVFIGKKLDKAKIEERFMPLLHPCFQKLRPPLTSPSPSFTSRKATLLNLAQFGQLQRALIGCWTQDVCRVSQACAGLHDEIFGNEAYTAFQSGTRGIKSGSPAGMQKVAGEGGAVWLHGLLPMTSVGKYVKAFKESLVIIKTPFHADHFDGEPMMFDDQKDVLAAGTMWLELTELKGNDETWNFVIEFKWRPETMASFFENEGSATNSSLVKVTIEDPEGDIENDDDLKFRVNLNPEKVEESGMSMHRLSLQLVGGKGSYRTYAIFFHTIDPTYQVHINIPDHRIPIFPTKEVFHQWHPLMSGLRKRARLRFLVRLKGLEKGPLDGMCGCCG